MLEGVLRSCCPGPAQREAVSRVFEEDGWERTRRMEGSMEVKTVLSHHPAPA